MEWMSGRGGGALTNKQQSLGQSSSFATLFNYSTYTLSRVTRYKGTMTESTPNFEKGIEYWENVDASVDGVLGGFGEGVSHCIC